MKRFSRMLAVGLSFVACAERATAQAVCTPGDREMIVTLSQEILEHRLELGGLRVPQFGGLAAYLTIHYDGYSDDDAAALLAELSQGGRRVAATEAADLAFLLDASRMPVAEAIAVHDMPLSEFFVLGRPMILRPLLLERDGAAYAEQREIYEQSAARFQSTVTIATIASAVLDQPDGIKRGLIAQAGEQGDVLVALAISVTLDDGFAQFQQLVADWDYDRGGDEAWLVNYAVGHLPGRVSGDVALWELRSDLPSYSVRYQAMLAAVSRADELSYPLGWMTTFLSHSGNHEQAGQAALAYLSAVEQGLFDPVADPEAAWLFQLRALAYFLPTDRIQRSLYGFTFLPSTIRHFAGTGEETFDRLLMLEAGVAMLGSGGEPERPDMLSPDADWDGFVRMVGAVSADPTTYQPEENVLAQLAVDLLWRSGDRPLAIDRAEAWLDVVGRMTAYRDWIRRLDVKCDAITAYPSQANYLSGAVPYRFPPVPRDDWEN